MSLNIKNERVHALAREAARRTGKSQTSVIEEAQTRLLEDVARTSNPDGAAIRRERHARMIIDTSAVIAILNGEPERDAFARAVLESSSARMSAANFLEVAVVVDSPRDPVKSWRFDELVGALGIEIVDVTVEQARIARAAYRDFGRGSGDAAGLNFGDCFAYALASATSEALMFKGDDFGKTDVRPAVS